MPGPSPERATERQDALAQLLRRIADGDSDALAALYDQTATPVYSLARRMLADPADAEEIAADVYRQAWQSANSWDGARGTVLAWLLMMTRSRCLDRIRARESRRKAEDPVRQQPVVQELNPARVDEADRVRKAVSELPPEQRVLIELAWFEGYSQSELAENTGVPLGTVKTRMRLGMLRLRNLLAQLEPYYR